MEFKLENQQYVELNNLLKLTGLCSSGGEAKTFIANGQVTVNGKIELRKRCKIRIQDTVKFNGVSIEIMDDDE